MQYRRSTTFFSSETPFYQCRQTFSQTELFLTFTEDDTYCYDDRAKVNKRYWKVLCYTKPLCDFLTICVTMFH